MVGRAESNSMTEDEYSRIENGQMAGEAILFMRSRPKNKDGTIGFIVKPDMPEWKAWSMYFRAHRMHRQHSFMMSRQERGYMVPCANPSTFDPAWRNWKEAAE